MISMKTFSYAYFLCFQIYPDPDSEKSIMSSVVYCIHHKEGCKWSDELRKLKVCAFFYSYFIKYRHHL